MGKCEDKINLWPSILSFVERLCYFGSVSKICSWRCFAAMLRAIKVWDFQSALDPRTPVDTLCLRTLVVSAVLQSQTSGAK